MHYDVAIIGAGPAGISAAIYLLRSSVSFVLLDRGAPGGKLNNIHRIDNYPGCPSIPGPELSMSLLKQLQGLGGKVEYGNAVEVRPDEEGYLIRLEDGHSLTAKSIIACSGSSARRLGVPGEKQLFGRGVSYCATCDGAFFRNKDVMVYGYKDFAVEDGIYLASICSHVYFVYPHPLEATERHLEELSSCSNVELIEGEVSSFYGEQRLQGATLNTKDGERRIEVSGAFPLSEQLSGASYLAPLEPKQENGFLVVGKDHETSLKGIYAAGDVVAKKLRQIVNAASEGAECAIEAINYVRGR